MKKTLTAIALFATLSAGAVTTANAAAVAVAKVAPCSTCTTLPAHACKNEGLQNYYYYFGAPCCAKPAAAPSKVAAAPCKAAPTCAPCCPKETARIQYDQVCTTSDPCDSGFRIWNPLTYFG